MQRDRSGYGIGLVAAVLFGASAPISKMLLDDIGPQFLAGLLYLGAFLAIAPLVASRRTRREASLQRSDLPRLATVVVTGGVVAPVLLMLGLERVSGVSGSLLLNLEGPLTLLVGVVVMHEYLGRRALVASVVIFAGSALIGLRSTEAGLSGLGLVLVAAACLAWAIDNNVTQSISGRDPFQIVAVKTGVAAAINITLAVGRGESVRSAAVVVAALALGAMAYGISIVLDAYALRTLGAAREAAVFATAPFAGAILAVMIGTGSWQAVDGLSAAGMAIGVAMLLGDRHDHRHVHEILEHEHRHAHDEHHDHTHDEKFGAEEELGESGHSHWHRHERLVHDHPHVSDVHHRHRHSSNDRR